MLVRIWNLLLSPLVLGLAFVAALLFASREERYAAFLVLFSFPIFLLLLWRIRTRHPSLKLSHWLVGKATAKTNLGAIGHILTASIEQSTRPLRYEPLVVSLSTDPAEPDHWRVGIHNRGWQRVGPVYISASELAALIAPALPLTPGAELPQEIKTPVLFPKQSTTVLRRKIAGATEVAHTAIAYFYVDGGTELTSARYQVAVEAELQPGPG